MAVSEIGDGGLPGWTFSLEELSAGYYRIIGKHLDGRSVGRDGGDEEATLAACVEDARTLVEKRSR